MKTNTERQSIDEIIEEHRAFEIEFADGQRESVAIKEAANDLYRPRPIGWTEEEPHPADVLRDYQHEAFAGSMEYAEEFNQSDLDYVFEPDGLPADPA